MRGVEGKRLAQGAEVFSVNIHLPGRARLAILRSVIVHCPERGTFNDKK
jgi:hypothetical protein